MGKNVVSHTVYGQNRGKRKLFRKLLKKSFRKKLYRSELFFEEVMKSSPIPKVGLEELVSCPRIVLEDFVSRNGNLSLQEIAVLCSLIRAHSPRNLLEIGTFDGNTTLQVALNAPGNATIHTIDLPDGVVETSQPVLESDLRFIEDKKKRKRKYEGAKGVCKIVQHFGDSTAYDFNRFTKEGKLDLIFIDGGHSYQCVSADTKKALEMRSEKGIVLWHDFTPLFGGVFTFLLELANTLPLVHIEGTNLVLYDPFLGL